MSSPRRLQLGAGRLEDLSVEVIDTFLDPSWLHFGDAEPGQVSHGAGYYLGLLVRRPVHFAGLALQRLRRRDEQLDRSHADVEELYRRTNFRGFRFAKGDRLPLDDASLDFIFSEHFLHHLFLDEAGALIRECRRVLRPGGVIRTVVPDADLRTYLPPERVGYPDVRMPFDSPMKHKTRYSVYMLEELLRMNGLDPVALRYCDRHGNDVVRDPGKLSDAYGACADPDCVFDLSYVMRKDSLIVDGVRRAESPPCAS